jgi:PAS domain S-box-containing protein
MATLMILSALIELNQSKQELYELMENQAHSLLESVTLSSANVLNLNNQLEDEFKRRLLNNANLVRSLYELGQVSNRRLFQICTENELFRINIFSKNGTKLFTSHERKHFDLPESGSPTTILGPLFNNMVDTLIIGLKPARFGTGFRYAVAIAADNRSVIVVNLDAENILHIRRELGFGVLMRQILRNPGIVYVALQDTQTILAASGNVQYLEPILSSEFLSRSLQDSVFVTRTTPFDSIQVFEAVHPFIFRNNRVGIFRLGLSLAPIEDINARIYRRMIIITIVLILSGSLIFTFLFIRQRYDLLQKQYQEVETYSSNIIHDVSDAIVVFSQNDGIKIFNNAAEVLFGKKADQVFGMPIESLLPTQTCSRILNSETNMLQIECPLNDRIRILLISKTGFTSEDGDLSTVLVIRDMTDQKLLENRIQRQERLSAMGELASGVAHEIRNPLNTIGTIVQQLDKDFDTQQDNDEYHNLAKIVYQEVRRINNTINEFLKFARPERSTPSQFNLKDFFRSLKKQYQPLLQKHQIQLEIQIKKDLSVYWDQKQMQQVMMNLLQNSIDAMTSGGEINISIEEKYTDKIEIIFSDSGPGMDNTVREKIFNLYYTTKADGTGIGLSMVQRIIFEHNGAISVQSKPGKGTWFFINMPFEIPDTKQKK